LLIYRKLRQNWVKVVNLDNIIGFGCLSLSKSCK